MAPTRTELLCFVPNLSLALRWSRASYDDANRLHLRHLIIQPACPLLMEQQRHCKSSRLPPHIPSDSYANAVAGCLHTGEGAGRACMNDSLNLSQFVARKYWLRSCPSPHHFRANRVKRGEFHRSASLSL